MMAPIHLDDAWLQESLARPSRAAKLLRATAIVFGVAFLASATFDVVSRQATSSYAVPVRTQTSIMQSIPVPQLRSDTNLLAESGDVDQAASDSFRAEEPMSVYSLPVEGRSPLAVVGGICLTLAAAAVFWRRPAWAMMPVTGVVKWFDSSKGFGFITPDDGSADVFVHQTSINSTGFRTLDEGARVEFEVATEGGRVSATNVSGPGGSPIESRGNGGYSGGKGGNGKGGGKGGRRRDDSEW